MEWQYFTEVAEMVKNLTEKLQGETGKIEQKCESYWPQLQKRPTPNELEDLNNLTKCLNEIQAELREVQKKAASGKILINFAGATNSGKSSLINALLRSRRLPVGFMQTTMCSFQVCTTNEEEWSATLKTDTDETVVLERSKNEKSVRDLLSKMSGKKHADKREEMGISTRSVVQVHWPEHLCNVLPLNVVLSDTPGLGEATESDEVITKSCREADIIVAVMDSMSPLKATVAELVKNVNCQFTFGVFTKWDECIRKEQEESEDEVDVAQTLECYKQDFHRALEGKCETFVVDVKSENTNDAGFKRFERKLQASATKFKCESLLEQAKSANRRSMDIAEKLKNIFDAKKEQKAASIKKKQDSMKEDEDSFNEIKRSLQSAKELIEGVYNENKKRIEEFEEGVRKGKPEDMVHAEFIAKVDECTRDTLVRQRNEIQSAVNKWANNHKCDSDVNRFVSDIDDIPLCEKQGLSKREYNWKLDLHAYCTNKYLYAALSVLGGSIAIAGGAGFAYLVTIVAGGTLFGLFCGKLFRWSYPISETKIRCWRIKLEGNLRKLDTSCRELIFKDIKRIEDKASGELNHAREKKEKKIQKEQEKSQSLTTWSKELQESHTCLTEINKEFVELLIKLLRAERESLAQRELNGEAQ